MRIGISATWLSNEASARNSGLSRYAANLIDQMSLLAPEHQFIVFAPETYQPPISWGLRDNIETHRITPSSLPKRVAWEHFAIHRLRKKHDLDIWFSAAQVLPIAPPIPTVVMIHDVIPLLFPEHHLKRTVLYYRWAIKHAAKKADLVLTNSECTKADAVKMFKIDPSKVLVTPLGPGNLAEPNKAEFEKIDLKPPYLLTLGNREWRKNLHGLLEAFKEIAQQKPDLTLAIAGAKRTTAEDTIGVQIDQLGLSDRVKLLGYVPDNALPDLFHNSAAFVFPSYYEGYGLPVLEAMLHGAVIACSNHSSVPEVAGDAAFYFDPANKGEMVKAILEAVNTKDREKRIEAGKNRASVFTWENTARLTLAALERFA